MIGVLIFPIPVAWTLPVPDSVFEIAARLPASLRRSRWAATPGPVRSSSGVELSREP